MRIFPKLEPKVVFWDKHNGFIGGITLYPFIFIFGKGNYNETTIAHETVHIRQQDAWWRYGGPLALLLWFLLYRFALPVGWNPFVYKWESEAYREANNLTESEIREKLKRSPYFLWWH